MDDLSSLINSISSDPQSMEKLKSLAAGLFGGENTPQSQAAPSSGGDSTIQDNTPSSSAGGSLPFDIGDISRMMSLMSAFNSPESDDRTALLISLKPHLSERRRERVDNAVKILKLIKLMPLLSQGKDLLKGV